MARAGELVHETLQLCADALEQVQARA